LQISELLKDLALNTEKTLEIKSKLNIEIDLGLGKETHPLASVKSFITYVQDLPNGTGN
jgi:hexokinase